MKKTNKVNNAKAVAEQTKANNKVTKSFKTKTIEVELTTKQLYDDVSVTLEKGTLYDMEHWAYKTEDVLAYELFGTARACEDGQTEILVAYSEDELNDMMVRAGLICNLFDKDSDTYALSKAVIKYCVRLLDILHDTSYNTTVVPKTDSKSKATSYDEYDDF